MSQTLPEHDAPAGPGSCPAPKRWLRAIWPVLLIAACAELGISVLNNSALPIYFTRGLSIDTAVYGVLMAQFFVAEVLFKSPLAVLSDRFGRKPLMLAGALVSVFTPVLLIKLHYAPGAIVVLVAFGVLRALDGLGQAALWPSLYAYVGDHVAKHERGKAMGALNVVYMVALALSFLAGGFADDTFGPTLTHQATLGQQMHDVGHRLGHAIGQAGHRISSTLHHHHHHPVPHAFTPSAPGVPYVAPVYQPEYYWPSFLLAAILFVIAATATLALKGRRPSETHTEEHASEEHITWQGFLAALRSVPQFLALAFVVFLGIGCIMTLIKPFALTTLRISETAFGVLALGPSLFIAMVALPAGHLGDKWGKARAIRLGFALCALGLWGLPLLETLHGGAGGFMVCASLLGIGFVLAFPAWLALLTDLGGEKQRGTVFGAVSTAQGAGALLGVLIGTTLYGHVAHLAPFIAAAALVTLGAVMALLVVHDVPHTQAEGPP